MTPAEHLHSAQAARLKLQELRERHGLPELELEETPALHADAKRFAQALEAAPDETAAANLLLLDTAGAQAFWYLINSRWPTLEPLVQTTVPELAPAPLPFAMLCRGELLWEHTEAPLPEVTSTELPPPAGAMESELEWEGSAHASSLPGLPRPVRSVLASPLLETAPVAEVDFTASESSGEVPDLRPDPAGWSLPHTGEQEKL